MTDPLNKNDVLAQYNRLKRLALGGNILAFILLTKPDYEVNWHHRVICNYINKFIKGEIERLMVFIQPRAGKSEIISRRLPAFIHGLNPNAEIMACTYNAELAGDMTKDVQRIMDRPDYHDLFPHTRITPEGSISKYARNSSEHEIMPYVEKDKPTIYYRGKYRAQGVSGSFSGRGSNCLVGKTRVITEIGILYIEDIYYLKNKPKVLSYNHETNSCEWKCIKATQKGRSKEIIKLFTKGNRQLECTQEHRIYSIRSGYTEALLLNRRNAVVIVDIQKQTLLHLQNFTEGTRASLQKLFQRDKKCTGQTKVFMVWNRIYTWACSSCKTIAARAQRYVLWYAVFKFTSRNQKRSKLHYPWVQKYCQAWSSILQRLQTYSKEEKNNNFTKKNMSTMFDRIHNCRCKKTLQQGMCRSSSLKKNDVDRESSLQRRSRLLYNVPRNETNSFRKRFIQMLGMWCTSKGYKIKEWCTQIKFNSPSYRSPQREQWHHKSNNIMFIVPHNTPQVESDSISILERISKKEVDVYDIEVEGNNNFFANEILVHNCIIIDDPIKNREDADSKVMRENVWKFYTSTLRTRLEKNGKILIVQTRWHPDDLSGRLLSLAKSDPKADQWTVVRFPAIKDEEDNPDDPRKIGEALWPEKYNLKWLEGARAAGSRDWSALYQQKPMSEDGNIFKSEWFKYYKVVPQKFDQMIQSWDFAVKDTTGADYNVGTVWGRVGTYKYLLHMERGRWPFPVVCQKVLDLSRRYPLAYKKLIEAKANGPAVKQTLDKHVSGIVEVEPFGDKVARANAVSPEFESGLVWLPDPQIAPWIYDFVNEMCEFPNGTHDDQVDSCSQALDCLRKAQLMYVPLSGHSDIIY
jgi:predicted phage terminase large subunit-like protein